METYKTLDLFAGIGGFSLGLERTGGFETVAFCEIDTYAGKVLKKHWPDVPLFTDINELTNERLKEADIYPDVITGGFPCQDLSVAGKQAGIDGERSGLWGEFARLIGEVRPRYAIVENVPALLCGDRGRWFGRVLGDLAQIGYDAEWHCIPASHLGAPHQRDRVWIVAFDPNSGNDGEVGKVQRGASADASGVRESVAYTRCVDVERHGQTGKQESNTRQSKEEFKRRFAFVRRGGGVGN